MVESVPNEATEKDISALNDALKDERMGAVTRIVNGIPGAEVALFLESLPGDKRQAVWDVVDESTQGEVLVSLHDEVRDNLIERMDTEQLVEVTKDLDLDDMADIIVDLPEEASSQLILSMDKSSRDLLNQVLSYDEDSAGGLMNPDVLTVRSDVSIEVVMRYMQFRDSIPEPIGDLFVVGRKGHYKGRVHLETMLVSDPKTMIKDIMNEDAPAILDKTPASEVAQDFEHNDWISAPVVDDKNILIGRITIDDIVDVIRDEAERSVMRMAGLNEEGDMFAPILTSSKRRAVWLGINLLTVLLAAFAIGFYEASIQQVVALGVLMPVVASMGGIAGSQTLTLMIRGMATGQVGSGNIKDLLSRELMIGIINSFIWAVVVAGIIVLWFQDYDLGLVIAMALAINLVAGALAGVLVPVLLRRMSIDPAIAGGVVLTTVTDLVGFVSFLSLGTWMLVN
ncbi:magnesium transporter [Marinicella sp. S1101]|uniref:magnesium transporter n=1 Tax=Marinicella marina TaxID=2996016 RepID=UPI0022608606|nr:magnesium transporter [Marinicella marina]MCX7552468.1 magnesium transporter [Marinicella marina]MDJ1139344.1 magnesium transporter [Marinicella marina]